MSIIKKKNIVLKGKHQKPIVADVFIKEASEKHPLVIFSHGYKGFKDWGCWDLVAHAFADAGFCFVKFNFSHNGGTVKQPIDFPDLEAFGNNNYIKELDDLETVIAWVTQADFEFSDRVSNKITLIGHSRGGGAVTLKAYEDSRISSVISWAGVCDYTRGFRDEEMLLMWKENGVTYVKNGRTQQQMPHYYQFYQNFKENEERLTIKTAAENLKIPHFIIHGDADETVSLEEANKLHKWNPDSKLFIIKEGNHVFGGKHPWDKKELPDHLNQTVQKSILFINNTP